MSIYRGYSTVDRTKKFKLVDFELVKRDLLNHFNIRRGEKLMNAPFGSIIWDSLFEQLTDDLRASIIDDVKRIVGYEIRVTMDSLTLTEYEYGLQIDLALTYIPDDQRATLSLRFDREAMTLTNI